MLRRPRSEFEFTGRSSTAFGLSTPPVTRLTSPDAFSRIKASLAPMNTMPIGWVSPLPRKVVTSRVGSFTVVGIPSDHADPIDKTDVVRQPNAIRHTRFLICLG